MDIDLLGITCNDDAKIIEQIREILSIEVEPDGLHFDATSIRAERITEDAEYLGPPHKIPRHPWDRQDQHSVSSFEIEPGEFVILSGSSGAGKTTLLNLLAALDWPDEGEIVVDGKNIAHLPLRSAASYRRLQVGIIFQAYNLLPQLTAIRNAALPMMVAGRLDLRRAE
jgi:ABC-type glutathione transport system ATPase component